MCSQQWANACPWTWGLNEISPCGNCNIKSCREKLWGIRHLSSSSPGHGGRRGFMQKTHEVNTLQRKAFEGLLLAHSEKRRSRGQERGRLCSHHASLCPSGKQDPSCAPADLTRGTWCNLGQSLRLNFPEWVSSPFFWAAGLQQLKLLPSEGEAFEESVCEHPMTQELGSGSVLSPPSAAHTGFFLAPVAFLSTSRRH